MKHYYKFINVSLITNEELLSEIEKHSTYEPQRIVRYNGIVFEVAEVKGNKVYWRVKH